MQLPPIDLSALFPHLAAQLDSLSRKLEQIMDTQAKYADVVAKLSADVDAHLTKETKDEADLVAANALIATLKDQVAHAGMSDVQEAEVLASLAALEAKLNPPAVVPAPEPTADPTPGPLPVDGPPAN